MLAVRNSERDQVAEVLPSERIAHARELVWRHGWNSIAYQILNPGFELWFSRQGDGVVGYVTSGGYRVAAGAPLCPKHRLSTVTEEFESDAHEAGLKTCFFGVQQAFDTDRATKPPRASLLLGAQPIWHPDHWAAIMAGKSSLRAQRSRAQNKDVRVLALTRLTEATIGPLKRCLQEWLETRGLPPMHFLVEPDILTRLYDRELFAAKQQGETIGFLVASPVPGRNGWLIELIVRCKHAPNGTTELLLDTAIEHLAAQGASFVTLGLSPLSKRSHVTGPPQPLWVQGFLNWVRAHSHRFYNFDGLDAFKAKFLPEHWEPLYLISSENTLSLKLFYAIAGAFSGTSPFRFLGQAIGRAASQEVRWLLSRNPHRHAAPAKRKEDPPLSSPFA